MPNALLDPKTERICDCDLPSSSADPRHAGHCVQGHRFDPAWLSSDKLFAEFFDRFESTRPGWHLPEYEPTEEEQTLRLQCQHREKAGRIPFGVRYLTRDNIAEVREELADAVNYLYLESLKNERDGDDPEWDVLLEIVNDLASAYSKLGALRHKHRGAP